MMSNVIKKMFFIVAIVMVFVLFICWTPEDGKTKGKEKKSSGSSKEKRIIIDEIKIEGRIRKPQAIFFLPRTKFTMDDMIVNESFIENITNVVDKE